MDIKYFNNNEYWLIYSDPKIILDHSAGKFISYIRCNNYTSQKERLEFFIKLVALLEENYDLPVAAKIGHTINANNLSPILFYCNENQKNILKKSLLELKAKIPEEYIHWLQPSPDYKIISWKWYWKSNQQTLNEISNKTHWTYKAGLRK